VSSSSPVTLHLHATATQPLASAAARGLDAKSPAGDGSATPQGTFTAQIAVTLYDGNGAPRSLTEGPAPITGAKLTGDDVAILEVQGLNGSNSDLTVTLRADDTYLAVEHRDGQTITYDSRNGPASLAQVPLATLAGQVVGLAGAAGSDTKLASAAPAALSQLVAPGGSIEGLTVTVTDAKGVSRYVGGADGVVSALRTGGDVALESVTVDDGVTTDSVRLLDGSGTTTVDGAALNGTVFTFSRDAQGEEIARVTSDGGALSDATPAAASAVDAFGDTLTIGTGAQGAVNIAVRDGFGNSFTFSEGGAGTSASLTAGISVGGSTNIAKADVVADESATLTTGSIASAATSLEADGTSAKNDGTLNVALDDTVSSAQTSSAGNEQSKAPQQNATSTLASAQVGIHATASGTLDVLGAAQAGVLDGAQSDTGDLLEGGASQEGKGAETLVDGASRTIVDASIETQATDVRNAAEAPKNSATSDFGDVSVTAFGHTSSALSDEEIDREDDVLYTTSQPDSLVL